MQNKFRQNISSQKLGFIGYIISFAQYYVSCNDAQHHNKDHKF